MSGEKIIAGLRQARAHAEQEARIVALEAELASMCEEANAAEAEVARLRAATPEQVIRIIERNTELEAEVERLRADNARAWDRVERGDKRCQEYEAENARLMALIEIIENLDPKVVEDARAALAGKDGIQ